MRERVKMMGRQCFLWYLKSEEKLSQSVFTKTCRVKTMLCLHCSICLSQWIKRWRCTTQIHGMWTSVWQIPPSIRYSYVLCVWCLFQEFFRCLQWNFVFSVKTFTPKYPYPFWYGHLLKCFFTCYSESFNIVNKFVRLLVLDMPFHKIYTFWYLDPEI